MKSRTCIEASSADDKADKIDCRLPVMALGRENGGGVGIAVGVGVGNPSFGLPAAVVAVARTVFGLLGGRRPPSGFLGFRIGARIEEITAGIPDATTSGGRRPGTCERPSRTDVPRALTGPVAMIEPGC